MSPSLESSQRASQRASQKFPVTPRTPTSINHPGGPGSATHGPGPPDIDRCSTSSFGRTMQVEEHALVWFGVVKRGWRLAWLMGSAVPPSWRVS